MKHFEKALKRRVIEDFVKSNSRSPTSQELRILLTKAGVAKPNLDKIGFSGYDVERPGFGQHASASQETANRRAFVDDLRAINGELDSLFGSLDDSFRGFMTNAYRLNRLLDIQGSRADNLLLLTSTADVFLHGIEEEFGAQNRVDLIKSTASVEAGAVTLPKQNWAEVNLEDATIRAAAFSASTLLGQSATSPVHALVETDGSTWEYLVYTDRERGRVSLLIDIVFTEDTDVSELRLNGLPIAVDSDLTATVFYSTGGSVVTPVEPVEQVLIKGQNTFPIGVSGVKKLQIRLSKTASDQKTTSGRQNVYVFSLDSIQVFNNSYRLAQDAELYSGPYSVTNAEGGDIAFTKLTLRSCCVKPPGTYVNWFASVNVDGPWLAVEERTGHAPIVSFASNAPGDSAQYIDSTLSAGSVLESVTGLENLQYATEGVLNVYVAENFVTKTPLSEVVINRNMPSSQATVLGLPPGWYETASGLMGTTFEVESEEGITLDLGSSNAFLSGTPVSGSVHVPKGVFQFTTSKANWLALPSGLSSPEDFLQNDPLYPYNHRYIIEGYQYRGDHTGLKPYFGTDKYYGQRLYYLAPEDFSNLEFSDERYYNSFTVENADGNLHFKVKVNKTDSSWVNELFDTTWILQDGPATSFYVRAVLNTSDPNVTPVINSFKARVI
jgi:hypothetical protein